MLLFVTVTVFTVGYRVYSPLSKTLYSIMKAMAPQDSQDHTIHLEASIPYKCLFRAIGEICDRVGVVPLSDID